MKRDILEQQILDLMKKSEDPKFSVSDRIWVRMYFDSIIDKISRNVRITKWVRDCEWLWKIKQEGKNKILADHIASEICEDIEFGYDKKRIYEKLIYGSYGNNELTNRMGRLIEFEEEQSIKKDTL